MSSIRNILAATALAGIAAPALAGGYEQPVHAPIIAAPPPPAPVAVVEPELTWTGKTIGVQLGYADVDAGAVTGDGYTFGWRGAYDIDFGRFVVGGLASLERGADLDLSNGAEVTYVKRIGGRIGADLGNSMIYGSGGYSKVWTDGAGLGDSSGYFAGLGAEVRLTEALSLGSEINYHQFDDFDAAGVEADVLTTNLSLNFRF